MQRGLAVLVCLGVATGCAGLGFAADAGPAAVAVVVELFTSEGCSSCPPADALLARLAREQPLPGIRVIALSEHVDYWDRLGWKDPFSSSVFTRRQNWYSVRWPTRVYTPQMVIGGVIERVGGAETEVIKAVRAVARLPQARVTVEARRLAPGAARLRASVSELPRARSADVYLAVVEDGLRVEVASGENGGRTLQHEAVVRRLAPLGRIARGGTSFAAERELRLDRGWRADRLRAVVFVQERKSRAIVGAAAAPFSSQPSSSAGSGKARGDKRGF